MLCALGSVNSIHDMRDAPDTSLSENVQHRSPVEPTRCPDLGSETLLAAACGALGVR